MTIEDSQRRSGRGRPRHLVALALLGVGVVCVVAGWVFAMVGPRELALLGAVGFLLSFAGFRFARRPDIVVELTPSADRRRRRLLWTIRGLAPLVLAALVANFAVGGLGGSAGLPVLKEREAYFLLDHGRLEPVPRWRYVLEGGSFATGWASMLLMMNLSLLCKGLYGKYPL